MNCLVVGETPYAALERLGPLIRNVHLADYETYPTTQAGDWYAAHWVKVISIFVVSFI